MSFTFPPDFETRMHANPKLAWGEFALSHENDPPVSIRINPLKNSLPVDQCIPWTVFGRYLDQRPVFTLDPSFHAGAYYVQEASSMFLEQVVKQSVDLSRPLRVLDLCAAPGGKSTHLLSLINADSLLVANEVIRSRASILSENIQKWGYPNVVVTNNDPADFQSLPGLFDLIIVDAPCSGEGLFRKDRSAMDEWSPDQVAHCSQRQKRIIKDVWPALKENGVMIYCTCTYNEEENEDNLAWLGKQHAIENVEIKIEESWGVEPVKKGNTNGYRFFPHRLRGEGFFIASIRKTENECAVNPKSKLSFSGTGRKTADQLNEWVKNSSRFHFVLQHDLILMLPVQYASDIAWFSERLKIVTKGTALATVKHEKLIPEHAAALSVALQSDFFGHENLDKEQALSYLRKDNLVVGAGKRGFTLMLHDRLPLGWANLLGNRLNNLYPSSWRIRMGS